MAEKYSNVVELLSQLRKLGIRLHVEKDRLKIDAPKGVLSSSLREELLRSKNGIIQYLEQGRFLETKNSDMIPLVSRSGDLSLSFSQERLWFLSQLEAGNAAFQISGGLRLEGHLRVGILKQSLLEIIRRHEALRTTFREVEGSPVQVISPGLGFDLPVVDLQGLAEAERKKESRRIADEEAHRSFDLSKGPLFRAMLIQLSQEEHILVVVMHHIITDGWSLGVFTRELEALYTAFSDGRPSPLPELPVQYADFVSWQRERLQGKVLDREIAYWKRQLEGKLAPLQLPSDRPRPAVQAYRGANHLFDLPADLLEKLKDLSRLKVVTLFITLLAAFKVLLYRYTGQTDFAVGSPIANRPRAELEGLIGFFVNTLVLRTDMSGDPSFVELLGQVRETMMGAHNHQELPFEKLVEVLNPTRDMSYSPLFQVMFTLLNIPTAAVEMPNLKLSPVAVDTGASMFDLTLFIWETEKGLSGRIEFNTDLFDARTIERMAGHFGVLLESIVADPTRRISELPILTEAERDKLLEGWNATQAAYPADKTVVQLFEEQVERSPEALAVLCKGTQLTYGELNRRADQLALYLRKLGVGPDVLVGLCMERSVDMVVGLFGILKAGGAYVPLDPGFPKDRLEFMLEDSAAPVLITESSLSEDLSGYEGEIVCIDTDWERIAEGSPGNPAAVGAIEDLAYVIYTSGSTGKPKGVQISHRALVNFLCSMQREPGLTSADTVLSVTTISFDIFGLELYLPLITGARVVLAERDDAAAGARLIELLRESEASVMQATPATWRLLLQAGWEGGRSLKILCGGEALPQDLVGPLLERCNELWNLYGPTETTIWSTVYRIKSKEDPLLIGRPIANTQIYILDNLLQPTPVGVAGGLHIGGDGLARGYLNRPELTAEKFIADRFSDDPKARIYKTGDLARYRPDGNIECLGRMDHQVKVRGFRIELGEIESTLTKVDEVHQCAVTVREDYPGDQRLVAYYVLKPGFEASISDWRKYLRSKLPDYMVPQQFVELASIPLTPNGKVDRKALPKPEAKELTETLDEAPQTPMEKLIAEIWQDLLGADRVSVHDNFFDLGGHSLLSMRVVSRLEKAVGLRINPVELILRTLEQLAVYCENRASLQKRPGELQRKLSKEFREPFFFRSLGRPLFGCYHAVQTGFARDCGIVLCYPMGQEYIRSHPTYMQLAVQLSRIGFPVLRFDYYGCGDSSGDSEDGSLRQWTSDVNTAIDEVLTRSGLKKACLLGLRLGATLAVIAEGKRSDVDALVLWNPVVSGESYIKELEVIQKEMLRFSYVDQRLCATNEGLTEILGFPLTGRLLNDLGKIDLLASKPKSSCNVLILENDENPDISRLRRNYTTSGLTCDFIEVRDPKIWLEEPYKGMLPREFIRRVVSWLSGVYE